MSAIPVTAAALLLVLALGIGIPPAASGAEPGAVDTQIVLAVDASRSVDADELRVQRGGYVLALTHPDLIRAIRAGALGRIALSYFEWSGRIRAASVVPWRVIDGEGAATDFAAAIAALPAVPSQGTSISRALEFGIALIEESPYPGARRVIDVSGDGPNNTGPPVAATRDRAVARGITVNGLPILLDPSASTPDLERYYGACVIGGEGAFLLAARAPEELARVIRRKLILEVSGLPGDARLRLAAAEPPVDCLIGERLRWRSIDTYYPRLYE